MNSLELLRKLEEEKELTFLEKILALTNGSVTQILEIYLGEPVKLCTLSQEVKDAGVLALDLELSEADEVNFREVEIADQKGKALIKARSWIPLKRLEEGFKEDLMKADVPIGKLLIKHKIEVRRELLEASIVADKVQRIYNILHKGEILMRVEETILI